jgi:hypothetical protein
MNAAVLTANEIAHTILQALVRTRFRFRLTVVESTTLDEGIRRIHQHESLLANLIPDLRRRLADLEVRTGLGCNPRVGVSLP